MKFSLRYALLVTTVLALGVWAVAVTIPNSFSAGDVISSSEVNENFTTLETAVTNLEGQVSDVNKNFTALNESKQERITGTCAAGSSIRTITPDGSVTCEVDDIGSGSGDAGVDAINGMTGAVILQAGDNITIDDATAGQITISALAGGASYQADDSSLKLTGNTFSIKDAGVSATKLADGAVTGSKLAFPLDFSGSSSSPAFSVVNSSGNGISGISGGGSIGLLGRSSARGVVGTQGDLGISCAGTYGVGGCAESDGTGVYGRSSSGIGVEGSSTSGRAVQGFSSTGIGVIGDSTTRGVVGTLGKTSCAGSYGVGGCASAAIGVLGRSSSNYGVYGESASTNAVYGVTTGSDTNATAIAGTSVNGYAAYFEAGNGVGGFATCTFHAGTTNWACSSDRNIKDNFEAINPAQYLEAVAAMPITTWTMKGSNIRQVGPSSQDFYAAFGLGEGDKTINNTDAQGVALAAIQGLYQLVQEQQMQIADLKAQLSALR